MKCAVGGLEKILQRMTLTRVVVFICGTFVVFMLLVGWVLFRIQTVEAISFHVGGKHVGAEVSVQEHMASAVEYMLVLLA